MQRYKLTLEYDGRPFCGWQKQSDNPSVQQCVEEAIQKFCGETAETIVAGRTDSGVHARGQVCHVDLQTQTTCHTIENALNAHLRGSTIAVLSAEKVDNNFSARFSATKRYYLYRIISRRPPLTLDKGLSWQVYQKLDVDKMNEAAQHLVGKKVDFSAFRSSECQAKNPFRSVDFIAFNVIPSNHLGGGQEIQMHISAISFLHHQVRNIIGTLKKVGEGIWEPEYVKDILESCDRNLAGPTAPAEGLYFMKVDY